MLWVYAGLDIPMLYTRAKQDLPESYVDFSKLNTTQLSTTVSSFCDHHREGHIFIGYLDPLLMLHPIEETLLRRGFTQCTLSVVVSNPYLLPFSWKNGIERLVVLESLHAINTKTLDHGGASHVQHQTEHGSSSTQITDKRDSDQGGKTGSAPKRRKQTRQDKTT